MNSKLELLIEGLNFPESPRWHEDKLWFSDMYTGRVMNIDLNARAQTVVESSGWLSGLGWTPDGCLHVVSMIDRQLLRLERGELVKAADLHELATYHCNDMVIDTDGRAYIGNFGFDVLQGKPFTYAELISVNPGGETGIAAGEMAFPNGMAITADGSTLIVAESFNDCLTAFDIRADGALSKRRTWASIKDLGPDGICLDAEGAIWVASPILGEVLRVREGGEVTHRFTPARCPYACMLGGPERRTLFVCESAPLDKLMNSPDMGCIEFCEVETPGTGLP